MSISRRGFVLGSVGAAGSVLPSRLFAGIGPEAQGSRDVVTSSEQRAQTATSLASLGDRFDPWVEVDPAALRYNVGVLSRLAGGRPIVAVIKNNAYGLGLTTVTPILETMPEVSGFAVVKTQEALALMAAGTAKPVMLMALFGDDEGAELVHQGVHLTLITDDGPARVLRAQERAGRTARLHAKIDTGMSRMGIPYHRALPWLERVRASGLSLESTFMGFTEDEEFDREQLRRFGEVATSARAAGVGLGRLHAASSHAVYNYRESHLDQVRPGISLFGAYPTDSGKEKDIAVLRPALRLRARVVRVERLRAGDSVSYGRHYVADRPTWVATLPVGHSDGYPREAVKGARVLVNGALYPVIGSVSASHTILSLGPFVGEESPPVAIGDVATLVGPDVPEIHPNAVASVTGRSVYDVLMHLSVGLPRVVV